MDVVSNVRTVEIAGFAAMLQALRLPFGLEVRIQVNESHWHKICDWIKTLHLAEDLILYDLESVDHE